MASTINTNIMSLTAQRSLGTSQATLGTSMQRLSSGLRINSAKDDAAGMAISERMSTQIRGINVAVRNANDGISLAQTAEGAMASVANNLQRIRELAVQSRNATNSDGDRAALNAEAQQLKSEIDRVASKTTFNGVNLLDGTFSGKAFQVGANAGDTITMDDIGNMASAALGTYDVTTASAVAASAFTAITAGDLTINGTSVGAVAADANATERAASLAAAINAVADTTGVYATNPTATTISLSSATGDPIVTAFAGVSATTATTGLTAGSSPVTATTGFASLDLTTTTGADTAIRAMDAAIDSVNTARANLGATQNRFAATVENLQINSENLSASKSRIMDADFAAETAALSRAQILQQAGTAMVAQANQMPQSVLKLLQ